jgi:hypothetical protein
MSTLIQSAGFCSDGHGVISKLTPQAIFAPDTSLLLLVIPNGFSREESAFTGIFLRRKRIRLPNVHCAQRAYVTSFCDQHHTNPTLARHRVAATGSTRD